MKRTKRPSQKEIAKHFNVSIATVSRALSGSPNIKRELKDGIIQFANDIGYNGLANSISKSRFLSIVPLSSAISGITEFYTDIVKEIERVVATLDAVIETKIVATSLIDRKFIEENLEEHDFDGLFVIGIDAGKDLMAWCERRKIPAVLVNGRDPEMLFSSVAPANFYGAHMMANRIFSEGHRHVYYYTTSIRPTIIERRRGFETAAEGKMCFTVYDVETTPLETFLSFLSADPKVTCVFCFNDVLAVELLQSLRGEYFEQRHISVVGFDNLSISNMTRPRLTTVDVDREAIGQQAVKLMQHEMDGGGSRLHTEILTRIVPGASLTPPAIARQSG